jgi:hypothetical protein
MKEEEEEEGTKKRERRKKQPLDAHTHFICFSTHLSSSSVRRCLFASAHLFT